MWSSLLVSALLWSSTQVDDKAEAPKYSVSFEGTSREVAAGDKGLFHVEIRAAEGYKINAKAPLKIALASDQLAIDKATLSHGDAKTKGDEHAPAFETGFSSTSAGDAKITGTASFFVCNAEMCERKSEKIELSVRVKASKKQG